MTETKQTVGVTVKKFIWNNYRIQGHVEPSRFSKFTRTLTTPEQNPVDAAVTAFCVPPCYLFPRTLGTSTVCSALPTLSDNSVLCVPFKPNDFTIKQNKRKYLSCICNTLTRIIFHRFSLSSCLAIAQHGLHISKHGIP